MTRDKGTKRHERQRQEDADSGRRKGRHRLRHEFGPYLGRGIREAPSERETSRKRLYKGIQALGGKPQRGNCLSIGEIQVL